jgi:cytoskeletal protein CcmA (bactofilin family)
MVGPADWPSRQFSKNRTDGPKRPSILCPGIEIKGDIVTDHEPVILGQVTGKRVQAPTVTVGPTAVFRADIKTNSIRVLGAMVGDIHAQASVVVQAST